MRERERERGGEGERNTVHCPLLIVVVDKSFTCFDATSEAIL